jgi:hypothetical protein
MPLKRITNTQRFYEGETYLEYSYTRPEISLDGPVWLTTQTKCSYTNKVISSNDDKELSRKEARSFWKYNKGLGFREIKNE